MDGTSVCRRKYGLSTTVECVSVCVCGMCETNRHKSYDRTHTPSNYSSIGILSIFYFDTHKHTDTHIRLDKSAFNRTGFVFTLQSGRFGRNVRSHAQYAQRYANATRFTRTSDFGLNGGGLRFGERTARVDRWMISRCAPLIRFASKV